MASDDIDDFDELTELEDEDAWYSDDPAEVKEVSLQSKLRSFAPVVVLIAAAVFFLPTTVGANINLNSAKNIEYGQAAKLAVACSGSTDIAVTPRSSFSNVANGTGTHFLESIQVSNIPSNCNGVDFILSVYNASSSSPLNIFNTSAKQAVVWNNNGDFTIGSSSYGANIQSSTGSFVITFDTPVATSANSVKIAIQTQLHSSCFENARIQCGFSAISTSFSGGAGVATSYDGNYVFVLDSSGNIYRSINSGKNFTKVLTDSSSTAISNISTSSSGQYVVASNLHISGGIFISSDYGATWTEDFPSAASADKSFSTARVSDDGGSIIGTLYGLQSGKIFYSHDFGNSWNFASVRGHSNNSTNSKNEGEINEDGSVMAVMMQNGKFFRSIDGGTTWDTQTAHSGNWSVFMSAQGDFMGTVQLDSALWWTSNGKALAPDWASKTFTYPEGPKQVYVCRNDPSRVAFQAFQTILISIDSGKSWTRQTSIGSGSWQGMAFNGDCSRLYLLKNDNKLYVSNG